MDNESDKTQAKPNPLRSIWPDVSTEKGRVDAIKAGAVALGYIAVSYAIGIGLIVMTGKDLVGAFVNEIEVIIALALNVVAIIVASLMAWFLYKRQSLIIACVGLAWVGFEVFMKLSSSPGRVFVVASLALLFSINGVRGALAAKKASQAPVQA
jgi:hypothetical protein